MLWLKYVLLLNDNKGAVTELQPKPCLSPEVEFCLRENYRFRAGLGICGRTDASQREVSDP